MKQLPASLITEYSRFIESRGVQADKHRFYLKWLRFYLDFCHKYSCGLFEKESLSSFSKKLEDKNQSEELRMQARQSVALFWDMQSHKEAASNDKIPQKNGLLPSDIPTTHNKIKPPYQAGRDRQSSFNEKLSDSKDSRTAVCEAKGCDWTGVYKKLENAIMLRHYSINTLKSYTYLTRKFQTFLKSKNPQLVEVDDVKSFLTYLAVEDGVSASSQNLAFNSLLFLFRNVFGKEFGKVDGIVRAKRKPYIPVVLSRGEVNQIVDNLRNPYNIIIKLMYGCGLRISECLSLRVQNFNFDMGILTIHDGKGKKDRTGPIPEVLMDELQVQLNHVISLHDEDCKTGYDGVFLINQLEKKYKNASKELVWQWFFPARELTFIPKLGQHRRYHVHDTVLQKALRSAVKRAKIPNPGKREVSRDSVQCPLEGYKCLGGMFTLLVLKVLSFFLFFTPRKGVLKRVTGFQE